METVQPDRRSGYEFDLYESRVIGDLAGIMSLVAGLTFAVAIGQGVLGGLQFWWGATATGLGSLIAAVLAGWIRKAAASFRDVAQTEGNDIMHLTTALSALKNMFRWQAWLSGLSVAGLILVVVFTIMAAGHSR